MVDVERQLSNMQIVVLMGGLGTRLGDKAGNMPKSMADVAGRPFFDYQLELLKSWGFRKFLFLVGYRAEAVEEYYGDGSGLGISIAYSYDGENALGTGGALRHAAEYLEDEFLLMYGDSFMDIDYMETLYRFYREGADGTKGLMVILHNQDDYDKSNVIYQDGRIVLYDKHHTVADMQYIDYGISILRKDCVLGYSDGEKFDLAEILTKLSGEGNLIPQVVSKRFYEIGRPEPLEDFRKYARQRFDRLNKAVFLDRDGVINEIAWNEDIEQLDSPLNIDEFRYKEDVVKALRIMQEKGYRLFIVTNQPAAAKGKTTLGKLYDINTWMLEDLKRQGVKIECVAMCPHHPKGDRPTGESFLIRKCDCRKPGVGLLRKITERYCIDLAGSYMVGDSYTDIQAGQAMGLHTVFIGNYKCDMCARLNYDKPGLVVSSLLDFSEMLV